MKISKGIWLILVIFILTGCGQVGKMMDNNPMKGMNQDEKVLFVIHEMYPEHQFIMIESIGDTAQLEDENGLQFEVNRIYSLASNQIMMADEYVYQQLVHNGIISEMETILRKYDYNLLIDEDNLNLSVEVNMIDRTPEEIATMIQELLELTKDLPVNQGSPFGKTGFSTGEPNYYSEAYMNGIFLELYYDKEGADTERKSDENELLFFLFTESEKGIEKLERDIQHGYWKVFVKSDSDVVYKSELNHNPYEERIYNIEHTDEKRHYIDEEVGISYDTPMEMREYFFKGLWVQGYYYSEYVFKESGPDQYIDNIIEVYTAHYDYSIEDKEVFKIELETNLRNSINDGIFADGEVVEFVSIEEYPHEKHEIFRVTIKEPYGFTSEQYYIMGDKKFALVEMTTNKDIPIYEEAALQIIDSIEWR